MISILDIAEATVYFSPSRRTDAETNTLLSLPIPGPSSLLLRNYGFMKISLNWFAVILFPKKVWMYDCDKRIVTFKIVSFMGLFLDISHRSFYLCNKSVTVSQMYIIQRSRCWYSSTSPVNPPLHPPPTHSSCTDTLVTLTSRQLSYM